MTQEHPITPSQEVVHQWAGYAKGYNIPGTVIEYIATQAARWGADQELMACINWLYENGWGQAVDGLRAARRPRPPSLKEQALKTLQKLSVSDYPCNYQGDEDWDTIRRAIESLTD